MTIKVPLDEPTELQPGLAYTIELQGTSAEPVAHIRNWDPSDAAEPITVEKPMTADHVILTALPE
jgi:hypothetical protein